MREPQANLASLRIRFSELRTDRHALLYQGTDHWLLRLAEFPTSVLGKKTYIYGLRPSIWLVDRRLINSSQSFFNRLLWI